MQKEKLVERAAETGRYLKAQLETLRRHRFVGDIRGIGTLWAIELMADRRTRKKFDAAQGVGTFVRDWCWEHGMILRNNGDALVIAPALVISRGEVDQAVALLGQALGAAEERWGSEA